MRASLELSCSQAILFYKACASEINFQTPAVRQGSIFCERSDASTWNKWARENNVLLFLHLTPWLRVLFFLSFAWQCTRRQIKPFPLLPWREFASFSLFRGNLRWRRFVWGMPILSRFAFGTEFEPERGESAACAQSSKFVCCSLGALPKLVYKTAPRCFCGPLVSTPQRFALLKHSKSEPLRRCCWSKLCNWWLVRRHPKICKNWAYINRSRHCYPRA